MTKKRKSSTPKGWPFWGGIVPLCLLLAGLTFGLEASAQGQNPVVRVDDTKHGGSFVVPQNQSQILRLDQPFTSLSVGQPKIADVLPLTDRSIYVLGKETGTTNLTIYGRNNNLLAVVDLVVSLDVAGLKRRLFELMPDEKIEVRPAAGALMLSGTVSSSTRLAQILSVANRYAEGKVTNLLTVRGSQQVLLAVRFAEVGRSVVKDLGLNTQLTGDRFAVTTGSLVASAIGSINPLAFATGAAHITAGKVTLDLLFDALEQKGAVRTLAEPNLIALSGDTASFLAGGEFPIPVASSPNALTGIQTVTVEFKPFGVSLAFTPTVLADGLINILVAPEVSKIDPNNSITVAGFNLPALQTRRAKTTVELRDGESFAIAGLIQNDFQDTVRQFPILGDIPILGALLRSSNFQRNETELVIVVTPHLAKSVPPSALMTPADRFVLPSDPELFLLGRNESSKSGTVQGSETLNRSGAGGIDGRYGHIIK
jgi:pilus assembly protein CpaC